MCSEVIMIESLAGQDRRVHLFQAKPALFSISNLAGHSLNRYICLLTGELSCVFDPGPVTGRLPDRSSKNFNCVACSDLFSGYFRVHYVTVVVVYVGECSVCSS